MTKWNIEKFSKIQWWWSVLGVVRNSLRTGLFANSHEESNIQGLQCWTASCQFGVRTLHTALDKTPRHSSLHPKAPHGFFQFPELIFTWFLSSPHSHTRPQYHQALLVCLSCVITATQWKIGPRGAESGRKFKKLLEVPRLKIVLAAMKTVGVREKLSEQIQITTLIRCLLCVSYCSKSITCT